MGLKIKKRITAVGVVIVLAVLACFPVYDALKGAADASTAHVEFELQSDEYNIEVYSNRHTTPESKTAKVQNKLDLEGYVKKAENDKIEVWFRSEVHGLRFVIKETGYIWGTILQDKADDLNQTWSSMANSFCTFEYFTPLETSANIGLAGSLDIDILNEEGKPTGMKETKSVSTEYIWNENGFDCMIDYVPLDIKLHVRMVMDGAQVKFSVVGMPEENGTYTAKSVCFMPFLGSTIEDETPGYFFVPDGPGALIRFRKSQAYIAGFEKKIYGKDFGIDSSAEVNSLNSSRPDDYLVSEPHVLMPVYGVVHGPNENAYMARVEEGEEYATILAVPAGTLRGYNYSYVRFEYRQRYIQPVNRTGSGVQAPQKETNILEPVIAFNFLNGDAADYIGMAQLYKSQLLEEGAITKLETVNDSVPIRIDLIGSDLKQGFLFFRNVPFTTVKQANEILDALEANGVRNVTLVYDGWQKGGINGSKKGETGFESKVGSKKEFEALRDRVNENGRFLLTYAPVMANFTQLNEYRQAATNLSKSYIEINRRNPAMVFMNYYFLRPSLVMKNLNKVLDTRSEFEFAINNVGAYLYADNTRNNVVSRVEAMDMNDQIDVNVFYKTNAYLWDTTDTMFDVPMVSSQYLFETDTVPFLQIVLRGSMQYYNSYLNIGSYSQSNLLRMLEYGAYPAFVLTGAESSALQDTQQQDLFSTYYQDWLPSIAYTYGVVNGVLSQVEGAEIVDHRALTYGVAMTVYSNGVRVYVNYGVNDYLYAADSVMVPAQSYAVTGGE